MSLTIRSAMPADERALRDLAALDSARVPGGETLLAFTGADLVAALELPTGRTIADPFVPTLGVVAALRAAAGLEPTRRDGPSLRPTRRLRPA